MSEQCTDGTGRCKNCESDNTIPVWSEAAEFRIGLDPEYLGCLDCNEMERIRSNSNVDRSLVTDTDYTDDPQEANDE